MIINLYSVQKFLEYLKLKVITLDDFCKITILEKEIFSYHYRNLLQHFNKELIAVTKAKINIQFQVDKYKFKLDWDALFNELNKLELRLNELLIIHKHLILIDSSDENLKTLKLNLKRREINFNRVKIELQEMQLEFNKIREQFLEIKKKS
jgi:hypothetical protein